MDLQIADTGRPTTKQMIWERKLLDFSLRNNLLNTRLGRRVVPFVSFAIDQLEDHLQQGEDYSIVALSDKKIEPGADGMYDSAVQAADQQQRATELIADHKIVSYLTESELQSAIKYVYRAARTALEENGANSLFLALGLLKWYETEKSTQPRFAPVLLLPVYIVRRNASNYIIRKRDEEVILNITLVELLKQNFGIDIDVLKNLPHDENGIDVKVVLDHVRRAIGEQQRWDVLEESLLGLFSFNKFVMWNDIHTNADKLKENSIIASLIENRDKQAAPTDGADASVIDCEHAPKDFAIPLDIDSSQMEAIVESGNGRSFILHGPPGTGKSQTITNMIANALYQGRRVLFVAEKMAALSVVQSRLERIGLAPFCLELHSNKATKKHFLEQMDEVLKIAKIKSPQEYAKRSAEVFQERKSLIAYMEALHQKMASGLSLYECITAYLAIEGNETPADQLPTSGISADYIRQCSEQTEATDAVLRIVGQPNRHGLYGLEPKDNRQETLAKLQQHLQDFASAYDKYVPMLKQLNDQTGLTLSYGNDMEWLQQFAGMIDTTNVRDELERNIAQRFDTSILSIDVATYRKTWSEAKAKWFVPRFFAKRSFIASMKQFGKVTEMDVDFLFDMAYHHQEFGKLIDMEKNTLADYSAAHGIDDQGRQAVFSNYASSQPTEWRTRFVKEAISLVNASRQVATLTEQVRQLTLLRYATQYIADTAPRWLANYQTMADWYHWVEQKHRLCQMGMQSVAANIEKGAAPQVAIKAFVKGIYRKLIETAIDNNQQLRTFNGLKFSQQIALYKRHTERFQELSKKELYSKLAARVPATVAETADGSEMSVLKRNIANGGHGNSIRTIIDSMPTLLPRLCPCMLMSPISVAQYIDLNAPKFDLVIFDEASQMPTSEAVGAIARGNALIVVGDSKQMPPTNFFNATQVDDDEADIDDMESILDDCITLSLCEHQLKWHYRSKHESLIAFSNSQYYGNSLLTFPSADNRTPKVRLVAVDGIYDKGNTRINPEESHAIVSEILQRLSDPVLRQRSIGVVAFSKAQGDRIEDDLTEALDSHPDLKEFAYNVAEPVFVKNLENVQGDERDVILFSVGYGTDKDGKVSMNFGPLNNSGGERRLNVAVSRARYEMMVYSSLRANQIDLRRSQARGVEGLKAFLEYAETGLLPASSAQGDAGQSKSMDDTRQAADDMIANQIANALRQHGYTADTQVGRSQFKVDVAVAHPSIPDRYILAILCDGATYRQTKTARDREIVQPNVLRMLGWHVTRVYSIDWYNHPQQVTATLLDELDAILHEQPTEQVQQLGQKEKQPAPLFDPKLIKPTHIEQQPQRNANRRDYQQADVSMKVDKAQFNPFAPAVSKVVHSIIKAEQPITQAYLCKQVAHALDYGHISQNIQRAVANVLQSAYRDPMTVGDTVAYWSSAKSAQGYTTYRSPSARAIGEIPPIEIANAIKELLAEEFSLPTERVPSLVARKFGFSTAGVKIADTIGQVLARLIENGTVTLNNNIVGC